MIYKEKSEGEQNIFPSWEHFVKCGFFKAKLIDLVAAYLKGNFPLVSTLCRGKNGDVWSQQEVNRDGKRGRIRARVSFCGFIM